MKNGTRKFIVITGGSFSGIGKGILTSGIGTLLTKEKKIIPIKCDGYLNSFPGLLSPSEHGEVFVLDDGGEVDMDFGHYERFLNISTRSEWNITMGKVYKSILHKEEMGYFLGKTIQIIPHVTSEIKNMILSNIEESNAEIILIEIGGTVGDIENSAFIESIRQMSIEFGRSCFVFIHLTYVPKNGDEQKSKLTQQSVRILNSFGIYPDIIIARCHEPLTNLVLEKISLFSNIEKKNIISYPTVSNIYQIPVILRDSGIHDTLSEKFDISLEPDVASFEAIGWPTSILSNKKSKLTIAIFGKYARDSDSYVSIREAIFSSSIYLGVSYEIFVIDVEDFSMTKKISSASAIIIPGGFGYRGYEEKIEVISFARENNIPILGICLGMQLMAIEFSRGPCGLSTANTSESLGRGFDNSIIPVICPLSSQGKVDIVGGTMCSGAMDVFIREGTRAYDIYKKRLLSRRFRHRYEVNPEYISVMQKKGLVFSAVDERRNAAQIVELPSHRFFLGCQFHPELSSRPSEPEQIFTALLSAAI